jgi:hypothetical protein
MCEDAAAAAADYFKVWGTTYDHLPEVFTDCSTWLESQTVAAAIVAKAPRTDRSYVFPQEDVAGDARQSWKRTNEMDALNRHDGRPLWTAERRLAEFNWVQALRSEWMAELDAEAAALELALGPTAWSEALDAQQRKRDAQTAAQARQLGGDDRDSDDSQATQEYTGYRSDSDSKDSQATQEYDYRDFEETKKNDISDAQEHGRLPPNLHVQVDNTTRQNKGAYWRFLSSVVNSPPESGRTLPEV